MISADRHLQIGSLLFDGINQIDVTGPFEVLSRLSDETHRLYASSGAPVRDVMACASLPMARSPTHRGWKFCTCPAAMARKP